MENASKALLMAGAILVAITIISIAIYIYTSSAGTVYNSEIPIDSALVKMHNKTFLQYDQRTITGYQARDCVSDVLNNNASVKQPELYVSVSVILKNGTIYYFAEATGEGSSREVKSPPTTPPSKLGEVSIEKSYVPAISMSKSGVIQTITLTQL